MSNRILFVDDEPSILGIYGMLQPFMGPGYSVVTAADGEQALALLEEETCDVVVSDLTMPKMGGIELLSEIAQRYPATGRIVVSGFADEITAAKCMMVGHRYFTKPFDPKALTEAVVKLCDARSFAANDRIREVVGKIDAIPTLSKTYLELTKALRSNSLPLRDITSIIEQDLALTAKVLQTVNCVRFATSQRVKTVFEAVQLIGFEVVRALVLSIQVFEFCQKTSKTELFHTVWAHSLRTAVRAKRLAEAENLSGELCDDAFLLGLLHDIGKVILGASSPEDYQSLWAVHHGDSTALVEAECDMFGADHAHVGAFLLRLWGLPESVASAVQMHHSVEEAGIRGFNPLLALHAAQELARDHKSSRLNQALINHLGLAGRLPRWRTLVETDSSGDTVFMNRR